MADPQKRPRLVILSRYDRLGASSRLRTIGYQPYLKSAGFDVDLIPFFDADYLRRFYAGGRRRIVPYLRRRADALRMARGADLIWLEKEALPWMPWLIERSLWPASVPVVSDHDDAVFHRYDKHRSVVVRGLLGHKIDRVMGASRIVFAGNDYIAARARTAGSARVEIVPTVVDLDLYHVKQNQAGSASAVLGWIGTPQTYQSLLRPFVTALRAAALESGAKLRLIGAGDAALADGVEVQDWSEDTEVDQIRSLAVGVMPLPDTPWTRGKCAYKLIQYMACGLPVVASPVGVNAQLVEHEVNGFLAETEADWKAALKRLLSDADLRKRMGANGRRKIEEGYSLQQYGPKVASMLYDIACDGRMSRK